MTKSGLAASAATAVGRHHEPGPDSQRRDYASFAHFADADGNTWVLQEIGYRRPPRRLTLAGVLVPSDSQGGATS